MSQPCGKSSQSPQTIAVFKKLHNQAPNKVCFDCPSKNCTWASIPYGVFICMNCAGFHRSLGTHISFVRSTQLDDWTPIQLAKMLAGGNMKAKKYFKERGGLLHTNELQQKYTSDCAALYKSNLANEAASRGVPEAFSPPGSPTAGPAAPAAVVDDFFNEFDMGASPNSKALAKPGLPNSLDTGAAAGLQRSASGSHLPPLPADEAPAKASKAEDDGAWGDGDGDDWGAPAAPAAPAAEAAAPKVIAAKSRASGIGKKPAKKKPVATKVTATKVGAPAVEGAPKKKKGGDWGDMDSFDDAKWDDLQAKSAKAQADASKPKTLVFDTPAQAVAPGGPAKKAKDPWEDPFKEPEGPSIQIVDKNWNKGKKANAAAAKKKAAEAAANPESTELRNKYAGQTSLGSAQVFGTGEAEASNWQDYSGQQSLGSDQYFGRGGGGGGGDDYDDYDSDEDDLDELVSNLAEETRRDLQVAAEMAGDFLSSMAEDWD